MESLTETPWDVLISGTGLPQSLLALALSRSDKKIIHADHNPFYGGSEAAFSLDEAQGWADTVNQEPENFPFEDAAVYSSQESGLSPSRRYTVSLSPQLVYARSELLPTLVSSKVYRQLEFHAVGSWWIHKPGDGNDASLYRVPGSREDVFADDKISVKSKRTLMRFLRHISKGQEDSEAPSEGDGEDLNTSLSSYLNSNFNVPAELVNPLLSLSLSQASPQQTSADYAVPRIKRHLGSIGVFGPGFGSLLAKYGGGSEISQVGCRALAVGGGVYVLGTGIKSFDQPAEPGNGEDARIKAQLSNGDTISTKYIFGSNWDLPSIPRPSCDKVARSITVVSSSLEILFPVTAEGGPVPAGAVVIFPGSSLGQADDAPPVYVLIHSSETGECPKDQCVLYSSVSIPGQTGQSLLESAVKKLLESTVESNAKILWSLRYTQHGRVSSNAVSQPANNSLAHISDNIACFPPASLDLAFDDSVLGAVKDAWKMVMGEEANDDDFMKFQDREGADAE